MSDRPQKIVRRGQAGTWIFDCRQPAVESIRNVTGENMALIGIVDWLVIVLVRTVAAYQRGEMLGQDRLVQSNR